MPPPRSRLSTLLPPAIATTVAGLAWWFFRNPWLAAMAVVAGGLFALALLAPRVHAPVDAAFRRVGRTLLAGLTWVLLGLLFALIFIPGRVVLAITARDPLERRADPNRRSYWRSVPAPADPERRFRSQF